MMAVMDAWRDKDVLKTPEKRPHNLAAAQGIVPTKIAVREYSPKGKDDDRGTCCLGLPKIYGQRHRPGQPGDKNPEQADAEIEQDIDVFCGVMGAVHPPQPIESLRAFQRMGPTVDPIVHEFRNENDHQKSGPKWIFDGFDA